MLTPARIAVLVSGGGTNLQALLDAQRDGKMPHGEIVLVVSSRAGAYALTRAENAGVAARVLTPSCGQEPFENELSVLLREQRSTSFSSQALRSSSAQNLQSSGRGAS